MASERPHHNLSVYRLPAGRLSITIGRLALSVDLPEPALLVFVATLARIFCLIASSSLSSLLAHSLELLSPYPHLRPPQSSLTLLPSLVTPYRSHRQVGGTLEQELEVALWGSLEKAPPDDILLSLRADGEDDVYRADRSDKRVEAKRSSKSSIGLTS